MDERRDVRNADHPEFSFRTTNAATDIAIDPHEVVRVQRILFQSITKYFDDNKHFSNGPTQPVQADDRFNFASKGVYLRPRKPTLNQYVIRSLLSGKSIEEEVSILRRYKLYYPNNVNEYSQIFCHLDKKQTCDKIKFTGQSAGPKKIPPHLEALMAQNEMNKIVQNEEGEDGESEQYPSWHLKYRGMPQYLSNGDLGFERVEKEINDLLQ
ncbi:hypothetical protein ACOME3_000065 [Neoechinorhynchus agilis]